MKEKGKKIPFLDLIFLLIYCIACQVFQCSHDDCAHFYHPKCIAQLLYPNSEEATLFEVEVAAAREKFTCPVHECIECKGVENKNDRSMQFAVCRRCPTVYHRKCLPRFVFLDNRHVPILCSFMFYLKIGPFFLRFCCCCFCSDIIFKSRKGPNGSLQRAWDDILPDRILIFCMYVNSLTFVTHIYAQPCLCLLSLFSRIDN